MPPTKRKKHSKESETFDVEKELETYQKEIQKIKEGIGMNIDICEDETKTDHGYIDSLSPENSDSENHNTTNGTVSEIKSYIRSQVRLMEQRINLRFDHIEDKINKLLERQTSQTPADTVIVEEHILDSDDAGPNSDTPEYKITHIASNDESVNLIFPIADEATFDWFFERLWHEEFRSNLINQQWHHATNKNAKSFNVSVNSFLRKHFDLTVCVKYSVSGFGAHGTRKRKLDSNSLISYVFDCFNRAYPDVYSYKECTRAIVQFWGRAPDLLNKSMARAQERSIKEEDSLKTNDSYT
ncbi:CLUMA_CG010925, isoform A [Clunio marinus]|uniref:CLUMA_CG010925, isoform A n=1 Tax=Clunio marinus TaxID=568069 RepID=A0A1J1IGF8_9DIPT|nr:CLUMA_CG010925, isoform A [Clunio marinus]